MNFALEAAVEACRERLDGIERRLQSWLKHQLGIPGVFSPYEKYFRRLILDRALEESKLAQLKYQSKPRLLRFFKNRIK